MELSLTGEAFKKGSLYFCNKLGFESMLIFIRIYLNYKVLSNHLEMLLLDIYKNVFSLLLVWLDPIVFLGQTIDRKRFTKMSICSWDK